MARSEFSDLLNRKALRAAPLVLVGFAGGFMHGHHPPTLDRTHRYELAVQSETVRQVSMPESMHEELSKAQPVIPLLPEHPPSEADVDAVGPPPDNSIAGSSLPDETLRGVQS